MNAPAGSPSAHLIGYALHQTTEEARAIDVTEGQTRGPQEAAGARVADHEVATAGRVDRDVEETIPDVVLCKARTGLHNSANIPRRWQAERSGRYVQVRANGVVMAEAPLLALLNDDPRVHDSRFGDACDLLSGHIHKRAY